MNYEFKVKFSGQVRIALTDKDVQEAASMVDSIDDLNDWEEGPFWDWLDEKLLEFDLVSSDRWDRWDTHHEDINSALPRLLDDIRLAVETRPPPQVIGQLNLTGDTVISRDGSMLMGPDGTLKE